MITKKVFIVTILFIEFLFLGYSTAYDYSFVGEKEFGQPKKIFQEDRLYAGNLGALLNFDNNQNLQYEHKSRLDSVQKAKEEIKEIQKKEYETDSAATCDSTITIIACGLSAAVDWYDQRDYANNGRITTTSDGRSYYYQSKEREKEIEISKAIIENKEKEITSLFDPLYKE